MILDLNALLLMMVNRNIFRLEVSHYCQSLVWLTAPLRAALEPNLLESALYGVLRLLPDLCSDPRGPEPEGVRVLQ